MTTGKKLARTLIFLLLSCSMISCAKKEPLEEIGSPPMTTMEMKAPQDDKTETWSMKVLPVTTAAPKQPCTINIQVKNESASTSADPKNQKIDSDTAHILIVSKDVDEFQNLRPIIEGGGRIQAVATFQHPGKYMLCFQFTTLTNKNHSLVQPLEIGAASTSDSIAKPAPSTDAEKPKEVDGYKFRVYDYPTQAGQIAMPTFRITKDSRPESAIQPIDPHNLKDAGYAVVIKSDGQSFIRTGSVNQPSANKLFQTPVMFHTIVPEPGLYKMWAQFKINDKVETVDFCFKVDKPEQ